MGIFERLKKYIERKKEAELMYESENVLIRLNHLQKMRPDKDGKYSLIHTSGYIYEFPKDMTSEDAIKVMSFLQDKIASDLNVGSKDIKVIVELNEILKRFHFKRLINEKVDEMEVLDFVNSSHKGLKFPKEDALTFVDDDWYYRGISQKTVENIYKERKEEIDLSPITFEAEGKFGTESVIYSKQEPKTM